MPAWQPPTAPRAADGMAEEVASEVADLWSSVTCGNEMTQVTSRWTYGDVRGSLFRESLVAAVGMDDVTAHQVLVRAKRILGDLSWHTQPITFALHRANGQSD